MTYPENSILMNHVESNHDLKSECKETRIQFFKTDEVLTVVTDFAIFTRWLLKHSSVELEKLKAKDNHSLNPTNWDGHSIYGGVFSIPPKLLKLKGKPRDRSEFSRILGDIPEELLEAH